MKKVIIIFLFFSVFLSSCQIKQTGQQYDIRERRDQLQGQMIQLSIPTGISDEKLSTLNGFLSMQWNGQCLKIVGLSYYRFQMETGVLELDCDRVGCSHKTWSCNALTSNYQYYSWLSDGSRLYTKGADIIKGTKSYYKNTVSYYDSLTDRNSVDIIDFFYDDETLYIQLPSMIYSVNKSDMTTLKKYELPTGEIIDKLAIGNGFFIYKNIYTRVNKYDMTTGEVEPVLKVGGDIYNLDGKVVYIEPKRKTYVLHWMDENGVDRELVDDCKSCFCIAEDRLWYLSYPDSQLRVYDFNQGQSHTVDLQIDAYLSDTKDALKNELNIRPWQIVDAFYHPDEKVIFFSEGEDYLYMVDAVTEKLLHVWEYPEIYSQISDD